MTSPYAYGHPFTVKKPSEDDETDETDETDEEVEECPYDPYEDGTFVHGRAKGQLFGLAHGEYPADVLPKREVDEFQVHCICGRMTVQSTRKKVVGWMDQHYVDGCSANTENFDPRFRVIEVLRGEKDAE